MIFSPDQFLKGALLVIVVIVMLVIVLPYLMGQGRR
jgi:hypothetical protein